jgi:hypothetical protein
VSRVIAAKAIRRDAAPEVVKAVDQEARPA